MWIEGACLGRFTNGPHNAGHVVGMLQILLLNRLGFSGLSCLRGYQKTLGALALRIIKSERRDYVFPSWVV